MLLLCCLILIGKKKNNEFQFSSAITNLTSKIDIMVFHYTEAIGILKGHQYLCCYILPNSYWQEKSRI